MFGDALEAFVGAIYLDKGFRFTRKFVIKKPFTVGVGEGLRGAGVEVDFWSIQ